MGNKLDGNKLRIGFIFILIVLVTIINCSCAFTNNAEPPVQVTSTATTQITEKTDTPEENEQPVDWISFTDPYYEISFRYPSGWSLETSEPLDGYTINPIRLYSWNLDQLTETPIPGNSQVPFDEIKIEISLLEHNGKLTLDQFINEFIKESEDGISDLIVEEPVRLMGFDGWKYVWVLPGDYETETNVVNTGKAIYIVSIFPANSDLASIADKILYSLDTQSSSTFSIPTQTLPPRIWTREIYEKFMLSGDYPLRNFILYGWNDYDGVEFLDDYPCYLVCPISMGVGEEESIIKDAFDENIAADFLCEWACQAVYHGFGPILKTNIISNYYFMNSHYGDPSVEPFCPQFADTSQTVPGFQFYRDFNCSVVQPTPTAIPSQALGWSDNTRKMIEDNYLWTILNDGFLVEPYSKSTQLNPDWTADEVSSLSDNEVCWIIANGHYIYGFPEYLPADEELEYYKIPGLRRQLRDTLQAVLGVSIDGNPPLCPNFIEMIDSVWVQP